MDAQLKAYINARLDTIHQAESEIRAAVNAPPPVPFLYEAVVINADLLLRDTAGNPAHTTDRTLAQPGEPGDVVKVGTHVKVYKDGQTAGVYRNRAWVTPEGLNVTTVVVISGVSKPTLQRV